MLFVVLIAVTACRGPAPANTRISPDRELAGRIEGLVDTVLTSDDESKTTAAFAEARAIFEREGVLSEARVGEAAAYGFVFLNMQRQTPEFRQTFLARAREADRRHELPPDAIVFAEARQKQAEIEQRYATQTPTNPTLRDRISTLLKEDQAVREKGAFDLEQMAAVDRKTAGPLRAIFDRHGVPSYDLVGVKAAKDFVVMVQHQPAEFRRVVLPKLKENVSAGQADPASYTLVYDRTQRDQQKNQLYGQNFECTASKTLEAGPMDDPGNVDLRRAAMGLIRLQLYARLVRLHSSNMCTSLPHGK